MKKLPGIVKGISGILDKLAGICIFAVMLLIVSNIFLRVVFNSPILGTYELVGFLTAMGIALALAHCAFQEGHIAVSFIFQRFSKKTQAVLDVSTNGTALLFWSMTVWYLAKFAHNMMVKGMVSPSAEIPIYPFIYLVALGLLGLCLVLFSKLALALKEVFVYIPLIDLSWGFKSSDTVKKGIR